jgi:hypothetical protein
VACVNRGVFAKTGWNHPGFFVLHSDNENHRYP